MGYQTVALPNSDKKEFVKELGAHAYLDTSKEHVVEALASMDELPILADTLVTSWKDES
jgi:D-arabinose 1-dehydrogenase-like Zn-dependent alcohol dehydrogenase